jgi:hypothetical protein
MAEIDASKTIPASGGTFDLDETRSYTIAVASGSSLTLNVDSGETVTVTPQMFPIVVGPGVGKLVIGGATITGGIFPRSDSRM